MTDINERSVELSQRSFHYDKGENYELIYASMIAHFSTTGN